MRWSAGWPALYKALTVARGVASGTCDVAAVAQLASGPSSDGRRPSGLESWTRGRFSRSKIAGPSVAAGALWVGSRGHRQRFSCAAIEWLDEPGSLIASITAPTIAATECAVAVADRGLASGAREPRITRAGDSRGALHADRAADRLHGGSWTATAPSAASRTGAPGNSRTDLLDPLNMVDRVNATCYRAAAPTFLTPRRAR